MKFVPDRDVLMPIIYAGNVDQRTGYVNAADLLY